MQAIILLKNGWWQGVEGDKEGWLRTFPNEQQALLFALDNNLRHYRVVPLYIAEKLHGTNVACFAV